MTPDVPHEDRVLKLDRGMSSVIRPIEKLLPRLEKVRQTAPAKWMACCPAHDDRSPSLSIRELSDGQLLVNCLAGCGGADVVRAVGLGFHDLYPENPQITKGCAPKFNAREVLEISKQETLVAAVGLDRLLAGEALTDEDIDHMRTSLHRLRGILGVV